MEELTPRLLLRDSLSSVVYARQVAFPDVSDYNQLKSESISEWKQNDRDQSESSCSSLRLRNEFSSADKVLSVSDLAQKSRFTTCRLGDLSSESDEENLFHNEDKLSTSLGSTIKGDREYFTVQFRTGGLLPDEIKLNLRITQTI